MEPEVTQTAVLKLWAWYDANKKQVKWGAAATTVLGLLIWFWVWQHTEKQVKAGEALSDVFVPLVISSGNARPDTADNFLKVARGYPSSDAGAQAMLLGAATLFTDGKFNDAKLQFDKFVREHRDSPFTSSALLGLAACLEAQNKTNEAMTAYKSLIDQHPNDPVVPQAKFALANLYEAQNKPELARNSFEELARARYTSIGSEAGMRLEELYQKHPNLAPAPPPPLSSPGTPELMALTNNPQALLRSNAQALATLTNALNKAIEAARSNTPAVVPATAPASTNNPAASQKK